MTLRHARKSGKLDNPANIDERHSDKQASRERPDPPDCNVYRIVFDQSLSAGFSVMFVGLSCLSEYPLTDYPKKVSKNTKT